MARRTSFLSAINRVAKAAARAQRQAQKAAVRAAAQAAKEAKQNYIEKRHADEEAEDRTAEVNEKVQELRGILLHTLSVDDIIKFDSLKVNDPYPAFNPDRNLATPIPLPTEEQVVGAVKPPNFLLRLLPGADARHLKALEQAKARFHVASQEHQRKESARKLEYDRVCQDYSKAKQAHEAIIQKRNAEIDEFEACYKESDPNAITSYNSMVLERSEYPEDFPQEFRIAYIPESKQLVIDYELPSPKIIPTIGEYKYNKSRDTIEEKPRKPTEIRELYQNVVASVALRTCHEVFEADQAAHLESVVFNGFVQTIDPSTGSDVRPFLISVRATKNRFLEIDLSRIEKKACLRNLGAQVSPKPYEVQPVKPIVEFDMVDKRFVQESDILSDLESRPNLMELNPFEFENLISNLFKQMGLDSKLTRSSRDGGVDVVAFDVRPVIGGKVVIQAKRYKNIVGVSAVRDLYGTMMNEGANKGILVTTSGYGQTSFDFAKDKPIELIDGGGLLYLLEQVGVKARIVFPEDWKDS